MMRFSILIATALLALPLRALPPLFAGMERPVTVEKELVPVPDIGEAAIVSSSGVELAFWWDWARGGRMFRSVAPLDEPYLSGEPFAPFRGFSGFGAIEIARVGAGFLMVVQGAEAGPSARTGFYALPFDADGEPLAGRPARIWDSPGYDAQPKLISNGETALLLWSEDYSVRTLQLGADGRLLEWSAPVESLAGTIQRLDATVVGSSYLLVVGATNHGGEGGLDLFAVPLTGDGNPSGPLVSVARRSEWSFDVAGGANFAFVAWFSDGWSGTVLAPDGSRLHEVAYPSLGTDPYYIRPKVARRAPGWTIVDTRAGGPNEIGLLDVDSNGSVVGSREIAFDSDELAGASRVSEDEAPLLVALSRHPDAQNGATWFVDATGGAPTRRSRISSLEPQQAAGVEASRSDLLLLWATMGDYGFTRLRGRLDSRAELLDVSVEDSPLFAVAASDGERFLLFERSEPASVYGWTLAARWIGGDGSVSEPFDVASEVFTHPVVTWSGTEFLAFWTRSAPFKYTLTSGEMFVSSIFPSGAVQSGPFALQWTFQEDALCGDPGCFVIWNDADLTQYCDFCTVPTRLLGAPTLHSGERVSDPVVLDDVARRARLAKAGSRIALVELVPEQGLRVRLLDWNGVESYRGMVASVDGEPPFDVASYGDGVVVVWEQHGVIVGALVGANGEPGEPFSVSASDYVSARPFVAVRGDTVIVTYDRETPEAGWVPRAYVRELSPRRPRTRGVRP